MRLGHAKNILRREVDIDLHKEDTVLLKEQDVYCFLLRCKESKAEPFMEWIVETVLPQEVRKLNSVIKEEDAATLPHCYNQIEALKFRNEEEFQAHQQAIEGKDAVLGLPNDDLQTRDNQILTIQHKNVALQAQRDVYQSHLLRCQDQIRDLIINHYVPRANDPGKDNTVVINEKNTAPKEDKFYEYPYHIARIQVY